MQVSVICSTDISQSQLRWEWGTHIFLDSFIDRAVKDDFICDVCPEPGSESRRPFSPRKSPGATLEFAASRAPWLSSEVSNPRYVCASAVSICGENVPWLQRLSPHTGPDRSYDSSRRVLTSGSLVIPRPCVLCWTRRLSLVSGGGLELKMSARRPRKMLASSTEPGSMFGLDMVLVINSGPAEIHRRRAPRSSPLGRTAGEYDYEGINSQLETRPGS